MGRTVKNIKIIFFLAIIGLSLVLSLHYLLPEDSVEVFVTKSGPYIGIQKPQELGYDGAGIKIAVIDTGVDYNHPDLFGLGPDGKVIGGYDFVDNDKTPFDTNGHGTEVAGIIAADGTISGIAPKAKILAYRVSDTGESVSSDLIVKAIEQAIIDKADIINISLGVNKTNNIIDDVVNKAVNNGIVVVTAAGNNGPGLRTIGSPGKNPNSITVGASYNNVTSSIVATFEAGIKQFLVFPMVGTNALVEPITGKIVFGKYGREKDLSNLDVNDAILLVERGSDTEGEVVYFSEKEKNAADNGAKAVIVYNNQEGIFFGELFHEFNSPNYIPRIPVLSLSNEEGVILKQMTENGTVGMLNIFYNPDFVVPFSSRGPVSPFYIKPDLVAPGAFVNTTLNNGRYNLTSGTSFAAPHVSGVIALLLQKDPTLTPEEVKSLLVTTATPVADPYGQQFPFEVAGTGRVNATRAFDANLVIKPSYLIFNLSTDKKTQSEHLQIKSLDGSFVVPSVSFEGDDVFDFDYRLENEMLSVTISVIDEVFGEYEGKVIIEHENIKYTVPVLIHITKGSLFVDENDGKLHFRITYPDKWSYAKISITNKETGKVETTSVTPNKIATLDIFDSGKYWMEGKITSDSIVSDVYGIIDVNLAETGGANFFSLLDIPQKTILIIFVITAIIAAIGFKIRR
jgi:minor extracellular serine protease Vpr